VIFLDEKQGIAALSAYALTCTAVIILSGTGGDGSS